MSQNKLLEELIDTSPLIAEFYSNQQMIDDPEMAGALTLNDFIRKGFEVLIELLEAQGVIFHVDEDEILSDFHNARFLIYLYNTYSPIFIERRLNNDPELYNKIKALLDGVSHTEFLITLIQFFEKHEPSMYHTDLKVFLFDKVMNTNQYASAILTILNNLAIQHKPTLSVDNDTTQFLSLLFKERIWSKGQISAIAGKLSLDISKLEILSNKFRLELIDGDLAYLHSKFKAGFDPNSDSAVMKCFEKIRMKSSFYIESYPKDTQLSRELIFMCVLAQISDYRIFGVTPDYTKLKSHSANAIVFVPTVVDLVNLNQ